MPQPHDASDPNKVSDQLAQAGRRQKRLDSALSELLSSGHGREWFWDLLGKCKILNNPFVPGDPHATSFACGEQNIGQQLVAQLSSVAPEVWALMMKEQGERDA